jgi:TetR/AcrR family transcriptional regulator, cholesterol catabolism regulator
MTDRTVAKRLGVQVQQSATDGAPAPGPLSPKAAEARRRIIAVAESLFTQRGFEGTSMRDIAAAAKLNVASSYYYFASKEELLWAVWEKGGLELLARAKSAIEGITDPWERIEAASIAHVAGLLDWRRANQILFVMPPWQYPEGIRDRVIALRDEYERIFTGLIDDLPLRKEVNRHQLRLMLIGALSWSLYWYKAGGDTPAEIARGMLNLLRAGVQTQERRPTVRPRIPRNGG